MLLGDLAAHTAALTPTTVAVVDPAAGASLDYRALAGLVEQASAQLAGAGLRAGEVVGLRGANTIAYVVGLLGAAQAGLVVAPLDPAVPPGEQQDRMSRLGARAVLTDVAGVSLPDCPELTVQINGTRCTVSGVPGAGGDPTAVGLEPADAMVMFTSGTTGRPKMVP